ncbi:MAG: YihY/virulence factor BrkB family protein [Acidimicrobiales bacterium]
MPSAMDRLKQRADDFQRSHPVAGFTYGVVRKAGDDKGSQLAALITYYGFFSLFPLLLVAFTTLGFVLQHNPSMREDIASTLQQRLPLPGITADTITGSGFALVVGILLTLWAGLGATQVAQDAVNTVWDVPRSAEPSFVRKRLNGLAILAVIGVGLIVATAASSLASFLGPAAGVGGALVSVLVNAAVIALMLHIMVERRPTWSEVRWGALFGGVGWTVLQLVGGWYTHRLVANANKTYGTFAVVIGLLSWIYLQAQVFVYAAEVASVSSRRLWPRALVPEHPTDADATVAAALVARTKPPV